MGLSGYSILRDPANALDRLGNSDILGMEDVYQWKLQSGVAPGNSTNHTQGTFSVSLTNPGTTELRSDPFVLTATLPASITIDLFIPTGGATGNAFMFVDCPSKGLTRFNIGNVSLSGRTQNAFNTLTFNQVPVEPDRQLVRRLPPDREAAGGWLRHLPARQRPRPGQRPGDAAAEPRVRGPHHRAVALVPHRRRGVLPAGHAGPAG